MKTPHVHPDWKKRLRHAYTAWLGYLLLALNALNYSYGFFLGYAPLPQWAMGLASAAIGLLIPYACILVQKSITGEKNADQ